MSLRTSALLTGVNELRGESVLGLAGRGTILVVKVASLLKIACLTVCILEWKKKQCRKYVTERLILGVGSCLVWVLLVQQLLCNLPLLIEVWTATQTSVGEVTARVVAQFVRGMTTSTIVDAVALITVGLTPLLPFEMFSLSLDWFGWQSLGDWLRLMPHIFLDYCNFVQFIRNHIRKIWSENASAAVDGNVKINDWRRAFSNEGRSILLMVR